MMRLRIIRCVNMSAKSKPQLRRANSVILDPEQEQKVITALSLLTEPVVISIHSNQWDSPATQAIQDLVNFTVSLMPERISSELIETRDPSALDPTVTIRNREGHVFGVQFIGAPSGLEYRAFIDAVVASTSTADLSPMWSRLLQEIHHPVKATIFVSPT